VFEFWGVQKLASGLVSNVPVAPVATKVPLGKETLYRLFPEVDTVVQGVVRSVLVNMFPPLPTATYLVAPDTVPKAMLFILGPAAPPLGTAVAEVHVLPSGLFKIEPSVPSAMNWLPSNVTALRSLANSVGIDVARVHAVTPGGFVLV